MQAMQANPSKREMELRQVWGQLCGEHRRCLIQLMAHLVVKMLVEQLEMGRKEVGDGSGR